MKSVAYLKLVAGAVVPLVLLCSCASSERMLRLSGGASRPPDASRLASSRWSQTARITRPLNLGGDLVNLWPFYYRNDDYVSALWPAFDYDGYGLAVRPFFNREGDEYSILFPLTAWNPVSGDGWGGIAYWRPKAFGMFPLFHSGPEVTYVLPVWFRNRPYEKRLITPLGGMLWNKDNSAGMWGPVQWDSADGEHSVLPLWYYGRTYNCLFPLYYYGSEKDEHLLITPLGGGSWNESERTLVFGNVYLGRESFGAFPLFHWGTEFRHIGPAWWTDKGNRGFFPIYWDIDHLHTVVPVYWNCGKSANTGIYPLFNIPLDPSRGEPVYWVMPFYLYFSPRTDSPDRSMKLLTPLGGWGRDEKGEIDFWHLLGPLLIRNTSGTGSSTGIALINWYWRSPYRRWNDISRLEGIVADPAAPEEVRNEAAALLAPDREFAEVERETAELRKTQWRDGWAVWPLLRWEKTPEQSTFEALPVDPFFALPLLRYEGGADDWSWNSFWLFGGKRKTSRQIRSGTSGEVIRFHNLLTGWNGRAVQGLECRARDPKYTPPPAEKELAGQLAEAAKAAKIEFNPDDAVATWKTQAELETRIFEVTATRTDYYLPFWHSTVRNGKLTRWYALCGILGYGLCDGDGARSQYHILGALARGKTDGTRSERRILEYLYFSEVDGDSGRTTLFPFLTFEHKGETEHSFSFLWRLFSLRERNGERSGYLFFFPFGIEKP